MIALAQLRTPTTWPTPDPVPEEQSAGPLQWLGAALMEAWDRLQYGLLLVDAARRIHFANAKARQQLNTSSSSGRLT